MSQKEIFIRGSMKLNNCNGCRNLFSERLIIEELFPEIRHQLKSLADLLFYAFIFVNITLLNSMFLGLFVKLVKAFKSDGEGEDFLEKGS